MSRTSWSTIKPTKVALTLLFEGKIFREMTTLMIAAQQGQCIRIGDLQGPQIENTLLEEYKKASLY